MRTIFRSVDTTKFSASGKEVVSANVSGIVTLWNVETGAAIRSIEACRDGLDDVLFFPNPRYLLTAGYDKSLKIWDLTTGNLR